MLRSAKRHSAQHMGLEQKDCRCFVKRLKESGKPIDAGNIPVSLQLVLKYVTLSGIIAI